jgi:tRNA (guanine37-N1)-methyltransferase
MKIDIITIFPEFFSSPFSQGIIKRAADAGIVQLSAVDLRLFTHDKHRTTDDRPFGGGEGMVMIPGPLFEAVESIKEEGQRGDMPPAHVIYLSPKGRTFSQEMARQLASKGHLILICGRYEGVDQRVIDELVDEEISIGDYVLSGGEPAALVVVDAVVRLLPGALGCETSAEHDSFSDGLLEHPHYTRPRQFRGLCVPDVLLSGDHARIERWRRRQSLKITLERRPDLLKQARLSPEDLEILKELKEGPGDGSGNHGPGRGARGGRGDKGGDEGR